MKSFGFHGRLPPTEVHEPESAVEAWDGVGMNRPDMVEGAPRRLKRVGSLGDQRSLKQRKAFS